ncbi:MAG: hypothetical protein NTW30_03940 [Candidatus Aenigmarchaeota archaeon]|nr:hypothetical protein [Candidatus Aenigmarchaeota archaeon]
MKKDFLKMVAVMLPILFLFFVSVSLAKTSSNQVVATVKILPRHLEIKIKIIQPENKTYYRTSDRDSILLIFKIDNIPFWMAFKSKYWVGYSLDDSPIVELKYYMKVINDVHPGTHKITVYANDTSGNIGSAEVYFTIKKRECKKLFSFKSLSLCL